MWRGWRTQWKPKQSRGKHTNSLAIKPRNPVLKAILPLAPIHNDLYMTKFLLLLCMCLVLYCKLFSIHFLDPCFLIHLFTNTQIVVLINLCCPGWPPVFTTFIKLLCVTPLIASEGIAHNAIPADTVLWHVRYVTTMALHHCSNGSRDQRHRSGRVFKCIRICYLW